MHDGNHEDIKWEVLLSSTIYNAVHKEEKYRLCFKLDIFFFCC